MYTSLITPKVAAAIFDNGENKAVFPDSPRYAKAVEALRRQAPDDEVMAIMDGRSYISSWSCGNFVIDKNQVRWSKDPSFPLHPSLQKRLMEYAENGYPADAFVKFLDRLLSNPSRRSIETFYGFIEQQGLTIDAEGYVIGYKGVNQNLRDCHTGTVDNSPGQHPKMDRRLVDDDPANECSTGFHFGGWEYAHTFGPRMVLVKVDPANLVCVPHDCSQGKVRVCEYEVLKEVTPESQMKALYEAGLIDDREEEGEEEEIVDGIECPACGTECERDDAFCRGCGLKLPEEAEDETEELPFAQFCARCGAKRPGDAPLGILANQCPVCGYGYGE